MIERIVKSQEQIAEAEVVVAVLFAAAVFGHTYRWQFSAVGKILGNNFFILLAAGLATVFSKIDIASINHTKCLAGRLVLEIAGEIVTCHGRFPFVKSLVTVHE